MRSKILQTFLMLLSLPADLLGLVVLALLYVASGFKVSHHSFQRGAWWLKMEHGSWLAAPGFSITVGHIIFVNPIHVSTEGDIHTSLMEHELVHVEQFEGHSVGGWLACFAVWVSYLVYSPLISLPFIPAIMYFGAGVAALLRSESYYYGNVWEEAAYGKRDAHPH